ncbi:MAG: hypothetical protein KAI43_10405 [Candidatus Aureabacteria bacterium]|nr:hypothetical protein [Candidatus Auribacterota bacterium]
MKLKDKIDILTVCQVHGYEGLGSKINKIYGKEHSDISLFQNINYVISSQKEKNYYPLELK